jgi:uncharacterized repeat protein (TIGR01451 family)
MYTLMPYENSLVAMRMNGPQLKGVLERAYRNYYYYKYVPGYGGYSHYTTCMLDISKGGVITYKDTYPALPDGHNVLSLVVNGQSVDFLDATTYYTVSSVNYLAAGSCNFNNDGETLWPLDQLVADTQFYVRDSVIDYITAEGTITPVIEGRLEFLSATSVPTDAESTLVYTDTQGNPTVIQVPAGAVTEAVTLVYVPQETATPSAGFFFAGHAFDLDAYKGDALVPGFVFSKPVTITINYSDADVTGLDEDTLMLEYWDGNAWVDAACGPYDRHQADNWLAVPICHLSRFALFSQMEPDLSTSGKTVADASGNGMAETSEILIFTIAITNTGNYGAGIILTDTLPTALTYVDGSLSWDFPGAGFTATVTNNVLMAHTEGYLSPPVGGSLYMPNAMTITFAAQVSDPPLLQDSITNTIELRDQLTVYNIPPAVIPVNEHTIFLPLVMKGFTGTVVNP